MTDYEADPWTVDESRHNENTLFKVRDALKMTGIPDEQIIDCINEMQNQGILFRERM